jgi:hypothetical protein
MADRDRALERATLRLLRSLGTFNVADETEAGLVERDGRGGKHPAPYDIESFAAGDLVDAELRARIATHIEQCASCRAEVAEFRNLMPPTETGDVVPLRGPEPPVYRCIFTMPQAAAAAGGEDGRRSSPDATVRVIALAEAAGTYVIAIQLANPTLRPHIVRLNPPSGEPIDEDLPPPDKQGLIQLVKTVVSQRDQRFVALLSSAPLDFLARHDDN